MPANQVQRACHAWPILVERAGLGTTITYGELGKAIGIHHRAVRYVLGVIQDYCLSEKLPPLTILVVNKDGVLGVGFIAWDVDDPDSGRKLVCGFNWSQLSNPFSYAKNGDTLDALVEKLIRAPNKASEIYSKIQNRGITQNIFRKALLSVYDGKCAFCGLSFEDALDAAHIVPWAKATHAQRINPSNGILLCSTHHRMFDSGLMTLSKTFKIKYRDPKGRIGIYTEADERISLLLNGKDALVPKDRRHQPSIESLTTNYKRHGWK